MRRKVLKTGFLLGLGIIMLCAWIVSGAFASFLDPAQVPLPGRSIPKYVDPLPHFAGQRVTEPNLTVTMEEFKQQVLPANAVNPLTGQPYPMTYVWGYKVNNSGPLYPAFTIEAQRNTPNMVLYLNNLKAPVLQKWLSVDQTLHWAAPLDPTHGCMMGIQPGQAPGFPCNQPYTGPVPAVAHLHGGEVQSAFDGHPDTWFTPDDVLDAAGATLGADVNLLGIVKAVAGSFLEVNSILKAGSEVYTPADQTAIGGTYVANVLQADVTVGAGVTLSGTVKVVASSVLTAGSFLEAGSEVVDPADQGAIGGAYIAIAGPGYVTDVYEYPNTQEAATLWFHDHALGTTRLNVYGGLAGFYFLRDPLNVPANLPGGPDDFTVIDDSDPLNPKEIKAEIEIVIQDRIFDTNGQWFFPDFPPLNPEHPFWNPEFLGDVIVVNGKTWPFMNVEPRRYRFRLLNGSNARFYRMWLENMITATPGPVFWQIGTDGGLLDTSVKLDRMDPINPLFLLLAPGERADLIIDFAGLEGQTLTLRNNARAPFPKGVAAYPQTVGQIMQFRVGNTVTAGSDPSYNPATAGPGSLRPNNPIKWLYNPNTLVVTPAQDVTRQLTLNEVMGPGGPLEVLLNNTKWEGMMSTNAGGITEMPQRGSTELWEIINLTADAHPIHLHLVQFQLVSRQKFNFNKYVKLYDSMFPAVTFNGVTYPGGVFIPAYGPPLQYDPGTPGAILGGNPNLTPYSQGPARPAEPNEMGWKDTVIMYPGEVTRIIVRWAPTDEDTGVPQPGNEYFAFDSTTDPGYVWHCHILDHEDNEMMRPYKVRW